MIGRHLNALPDPNMAEFYTSGRTSNEAAFLYQLFVREYGTNNFPDCSNMCHEATSVGLPKSLGVGKGTVLLEDFDKADCIFIFGQNPGTNSPRMMTSLRNASRRGAAIISFNPFRERALERFQAPQNPVEMATLSSTPISSRLLPGARRRRHRRAQGHDEGPGRGRRRSARRRRSAEVLDRDFIRGHTHGIEALAAICARRSWDANRIGNPACRARTSNTPRDIYMKAERAIIVYGMGITQHRRGADNVQQIANLALLRGNIGRDRRRPVPGARPFQRAGRSHRRHHRKADRRSSSTAGTAVRLQAADAAHGHDVVAALEAMLRGEVKVFIAHGRQFRRRGAGLATTCRRRSAISTSRSTSRPNSTAATSYMASKR